MLNNTIKEFEIDIDDLDLPVLKERGISEEDLLKWKDEGYKICYRLSEVVMWNNPDIAAAWAERSGVLVSIEKLRGENPGDSEPNPF